MFKRSGERSRIDSVSLVEAEVKQLPDGSVGHIKMRLCYMESKSGITFGYVDLVHNPSTGIESLGPNALAAWAKFCEAVEKEQGSLIFGEGLVGQMGFDFPPEANVDELNIEFAGLGGGY